MIEPPIDPPEVSIQEVAEEISKNTYFILKATIENQMSGWAREKTIAGIVKMLDGIEEAVEKAVIEDEDEI